MNKEIKDKWLNALRSGEYQQTKSVLHDAAGFCCLGVLCDLYAKEHDLKWEPTQDSGHECFFLPTLGTLANDASQPNCENSSTTLPKAVVEWSGLAAENPWIDTEDEDGGKDMELVAELNDRGKPFTDLAQLIEDQL